MTVLSPEWRSLRYEKGKASPAQGLWTDIDDYRTIDQRTNSWQILASTDDLLIMSHLASRSRGADVWIAWRK